MRRLLLLAFSLSRLIGCEQHAATDPPPVISGGPDPAPSSSALEALRFGPHAQDAGPSGTDTSRAMAVTLCAWGPTACPAPESDASVEGAYRVVFGSGHGAIRSREQAMTDLYEELRNRTALGQRFDAEPHAPGGNVDGESHRGRPAKKTSSGSSDPLTQCAFRLLDLVDSAGEVTIDRVHGGSSTGCLVSLGGASQCLVDEPERAHRPGRAGGLSF